MHRGKSNLFCQNCRFSFHPQPGVTKGSKSESPLSNTPLPKVGGFDRSSDNSPPLSFVKTVIIQFERVLTILTTERVEPVLTGIERPIF